MNIKRITKKVFLGVVILIITVILIIFILNTWVKYSTKKQIITNYSSLKDIDCIIVLGAGVWGSEPSPMLKDRILKGIEVYKSGVSPKIIMSGDHTKTNYDEVNIMKNYAINEGVSSSDIFMDHAGISTYDSIYRAKNIFKAKKIIIVTQKYHLYRALFIANKLGLEAYGVAASPKKHGQLLRDIREILARNKDFVKCIFAPSSTYLGEETPVSGDGNITNDVKITKTKRKED